MQRYSHTHTAGHNEQKLLLSPLKELSTWKQQNRKRIQTKTGILSLNDEEWGWSRSHETCCQTNEWMNEWTALMCIWPEISSLLENIWFAPFDGKTEVRMLFISAQYVRSFTWYRRITTVATFCYETELKSMYSIWMILPMEESSTIQRYSHYNEKINM